MEVNGEIYVLTPCNPMEEPRYPWMGGGSVGQNQQGVLEKR